MSDKNERQSNIEENIFIYLGLSAMLITIVWWSAGDHITWGIFKLLRAEIHALYSALNLIDIHSEYLGQLLIKMDAITKSDAISGSRLVGMIAYVENTVKYFTIIPFGVLVVVMTLKRRTIYNREFNGNTLIKEMSKSFPRIKPIVHLDFGQSDSERGAFTYPQSPFEWARDKGIIIDHKNPGKTRDTFDPVKCRKEIISDIKTDVFKGASPENMDVVRRFLFAVYGLWYMEEYKEHNNLLDRGAEWFMVYNPKNESAIKTKFRKTFKISHPPMYSWKIPGKWVRKINEYCVQAEKNNRVQRIINKFVFTDTVLKGMMEQIPKTTAAYYIWMKAIDKNLFYTMHQTGLEGAPPIVKGISYIFKEEKKMANKGERLVTLQEQRQLTSKEILSRINFDHCVTDMYWSIDKTGFMHQHDIVEFTDEELANLMKSKSEIRQIDIERPLWMFYETSGGSKKTKQARTIRTIVFYSPIEHEVIKEFDIPQGRLSEDDKSLLEWYMLNNYIHVLDVAYVTRWLNARGINQELLMYDMIWDAQEAYQNEILESEYKVSQYLGLTLKEVIERNKSAGITTFTTTDIRVKEIFQRIQTELLLRYQ